MINILLVDDQLSGLITLEEILCGLPDTQLLKSSSAKEALRIMLDHQVDCILLDVSMPVMDGFDFLKALHSAPAHASIPVIMVTGKIFSDNETLRAYQLGAVDFLLKPLDSQVVYRKVGFIVEQARRAKNLDVLEVTLNRIDEGLLDRLIQLKLNVQQEDEPTLQSALTYALELKQSWDTRKQSISKIDL